MRQIGKGEGTEMYGEGCGESSGCLSLWLRMLVK